MFEFLKTITMPGIVTKAYCSDESVDMPVDMVNVEDNPVDMNSSQELVDSPPNQSGVQAPEKETTHRRRCRGYRRHHPDIPDNQTGDGIPQHPWGHRFHRYHHHHHKGFPPGHSEEGLQHPSDPQVDVTQSTHTGTDSNNLEDYLPNRHFRFHHPVHYRHYQFRERSKPSLQERLLAEFDFI